MNWINKIELRKIVVSDVPYLWKRGHYHLPEFEHSECVEKVIIYLEGFKNSPLQLLFREEDNLTLKRDVTKEKWCVGYPENGVIWLFKQQSDRKPSLEHLEINLNRPAVIAKLIAHFIGNEWKPRESTKPVVIEDALKYLELIDLPKGS